MWVEYGKHQFGESRPAQAREVLNKAIKSLPKTQHVEVITQFALLEYRCALRGSVGPSVGGRCGLTRAARSFGDLERARTIFEKLISTYPKRVDLWSIYIDKVWRCFGVCS